MYQTDISTSSSQEKHYHPKRLLITLNEHPTQEQAQRSAILPEVSNTGLLTPADRAPGNSHQRPRVKRASYSALCANAACAGKLHGRAPTL